MRREDLVEYREVMEATGLPVRTLQGRIRAMGIATYRDPRDRRRRLIHRDDLTKLIAIEPVERRAGMAA